MTVLGRKLETDRAAVRAAVEGLHASLEGARAALRRLRACPWCGAVFVRHRQQRYCSLACSNAVRKERYLVTRGRQNGGAGA